MTTMASAMSLAAGYPVGVRIDAALEPALGRSSGPADDHGRA